MSLNLSYRMNCMNEIKGVDQSLEKLSSLSVDLKERLTERCPVDDRTMLALSRLASQLIFEGISSDLPKAFYELCNVAEDYWLYSAHNEDNKNLCFSYIRVYQITRMIKVFEKEKEYDKLLFDEAEKKQRYYDLLTKVYIDPGITHEVLSEELGITPYALSRRANKLEESGHVFIRRIKNKKFYFLSSLGIALFKRLDDNPARKLNAKHLELLLYIFSYFIRNDPKISVHPNRVTNLLMQLSSYDTDSLDSFLKQIRQNPEFRHNSNIFNAGFGDEELISEETLTFYSLGIDDAISYQQKKKINLKITDKNNYAKP